MHRLLTIALAMALCAAEAAPPLAVDTSLAPKGVFSADKTLAVFAPDIPGDEIGYRTPILHFANGIASDLKQVTNLKPPVRIAPAIIIACGDGLGDDGSFTNNPSVKVSVSLREGERQTRIFLPAPAHTDQAKLEHAIAKAWFGMWGGVPDWFVEGVLRLADPETAIADIDTVLEEWRAGFLPTLPELCAGEGGAPARTFMAHWLRDANMVGSLTDSLAAGEPWPDAPSLARELAGSEIFAAQEAALDERLLKLNRTVLKPGDASLRDMAVFSSHLSLYPAVFDIRFGDGSRKISFRQAVAARTDPLVRMAALLKMRDLPLSAVGRGDALQDAAVAYVEFLKLLASGAGETALSDALDAAEAKLAAAKSAKTPKPANTNGN